MKSDASFLSEDQLQNLLRKTAADPAVGAGWRTFDARMRSYTDARLAELEAFRLEATERAARLGGNKVFTRGNFLRLMAQAAADLAFHYRVTRAESSLKAVRLLAGWQLDEPRWAAQASMNSWRADLWTAEISFAMGTAFGFVRDALEEEERASWKEALAAKGVEPILSEWIDPRSRIHALDSMGHNWWSVCVGGAATALFALDGDYPETDAWLDRIADGFLEFFAYPGNVLQNKHPNFGPQGDFIESLGYMDYTLSNFILFADLYRRRFGRDLAAELPVLAETCDYYLANVQPLEGRLYRLNFGDMGCGPDTMGAYNHHPTPVWLWLASRFRRDDLFHLVRRTHPHPSTFLEFLYWPDDLAGASFATAPGSRIFENAGTAILRDGYEETSTVFAIKTGEKWNHNHSDAGSFILSSAGREFLIDSGTTEYSNPLAGGYFKASEAHNVVLHDGRGQSDELDYSGTKFPGRIAASLLSDSYRYVLADATGPWQGVYRRFYRHVLWIRDVIVLVDDLQADFAAPWTQLLHYRGAARSSDGVTRIDNGGKVLSIHHLFPAPERFETRSGHLSHIRESPLKYEYRIEELPYLAVHYAGRDRREKIIQAIELPDGAAKTITRIEGPGFSGLRIAWEDEEWEIVCNHAADGRTMHQNSLLAFGEFTTDAFLVVLQRSRPGKLLSASLHNGSFLRKDGAVLYSALLKGDVRLRHQPEGLQVHSNSTRETHADFSSDESSRKPHRARLSACGVETLQPLHP